MQPNSQTTNLRTIATFAVIAVILLLAVVFGVRWAKQQAGSYANKSTTAPVATTQATKKPAAKPSQPANNSSSNSAATSSTPAPSTPSKPAPVAATTPAPTPSNITATPATVPSTGPGNIILPIAALAALAFAVVSYTQTRRKLLAIR